MKHVLRALSFVTIVCCLAAAVDAAGPKGLLTVWDTTPYEQYDLAVTPDGTVWVAVEDEVYSFDPTDGSTTEYQALFMVAPDFKVITPAPDGTLWMSDEFGERIVHFDPVSEVFTPYTIPKPQFNDPATPAGVTIGPDGHVWFTTHYNDDAIGRLDPNTGDFSRFQPPGGSDRGMPVEIAFDSSGAAWFTLDVHHGDPGLGRYHPSSGFDVWTNPYTGTMTPFGLVVIDDEIFFIDHGAGKLVHFDPVSEVFTPHDVPTGLTDAHFLTEGRNGLLYTVALASRSLAAFDPQAMAWAGVRAIHTNPDSQPMGITTAPDGAIWWAEDSRLAVDYGGVGRFVPFGPAALAIGAPGEDDGRGSVAAVFGSPGGLTADFNQYITQDSEGMTDSGENSDNFGYALASGDFNCDTVLDLAIGVEGEEVNGHSGAGAVHIVFGVASGGLNTQTNQLVHQDTTGILDEASVNDSFGWALAAGDFDSDGCDDLAIGVPSEDRDGITDAGIVNVIRGSSDGLTLAGNLIIWQDTPGMGGAAEGGDRFGHAVATGDFDGDGYDDLAIGVPFEDLEPLDEAGVVQVIYGADIGLTAARDQMWHQDVGGMFGVAESDDHFGWDVAAGDFDADGADDLAIGVPQEEVGDVYQAGAAAVVYGEVGVGLGSSNQLWYQDFTGIEDAGEAGDHYGQSLACGDFNGDGYDDLAAGVPFESIDSATWAGAVSVLYGTFAGLSSMDDELWHQNVTGIWSTCENWDRFGFRVAAADFDLDGCDDLVIGVPFEDMVDTVETGAVHVLYGTTSGITATNDDTLYQGGSGLADAYEEYDHFGYGLAAIYNSNSLVFAHGFESGDISGWSSSTP